MTCHFSQPQPFRKKIQRPPLNNFLGVATSEKGRSQINSKYLSIPPIHSLNSNEFLAHHRIDATSEFRFLFALWRRRERGGESSPFGGGAVGPERPPEEELGRHKHLERRGGRVPRRPSLSALNFFKKNDTIQLKWCFSVGWKVG